MATHPFSSLRSYLHEAIWNIWIGSLAAAVGIYELLRNFIHSPLPTIPTHFYWIGGIILLLIAPFRAYLNERRRADIYETICRQIFEENFVFLNFGRESRRPPAGAVKEGLQLLETINDEVQSGDLSRAGMAIPLFHEMYNLVLQYYGGATEGTAKYLDSARATVDFILAKGYPKRQMSAHLRSEAFEVYRERWAGK